MLECRFLINGLGEMRELFFILTLFCYVGCQKNSAPEEIVRIKPGISVGEQIAPAIKRQQNGSKITIVLDSVSAEDIELNLTRNSQRVTPKYQPLYISGKKATIIKKQKEKINKALEGKKPLKVKK